MPDIGALEQLLAALLWNVSLLLKNEKEGTNVWLKFQKRRAMHLDI